MNVVNIACLMFGLGFILWAATFGVRGLLNDHSAPPKTPAGGNSTSSRNVPPAGPQQPASALTSPDRGAGRCRRRVVPSVPRSLGSTLGPGWRLQ